MWNEEKDEQDFYKLLGVNREASAREISKAFRRRALEAHPDKGGNKEQMAALNEAYEILRDPEKRAVFDFELKNFHDDNEDELQPVAGYIQNDWIPFSLIYKQQHAELVSQYHQQRLNFDLDNYFQPFKSKLYCGYENLFNLIWDRSARSTRYASTTQISELLNPSLAIAMFINFLKGEYYGETLVNKTAYLSTELDKAKIITPYASELLLYEGIFELFVLGSDESAQQNKLLLSIKKITDYAKQAPAEAMPFIVPLLQNKHFRNLFAQALHQYWQSDNQSTDQTILKFLKSFNGVEATKTILDSLRMRLSQSKISGNLKTLISYVKTLHKFEQDLAKDSEPNKSAEFYRDRAYHILDWIPAFSGMISSQIMINIFLRIGTYFQLASLKKTRDPAIQMADEQLALQMYLIVFSVAHHVTPDVELYAYIHALKNITYFKYQKNIREIIQALQRKVLSITDLFPFFESISPNIDFLVKEQQSIGLMRNLLHTLIQIIKDNRAGESDISIEHDYIPVLYQAYEACLKTWYEESSEQNSEQGEGLRLALMDELLFKKGWTFLDLEINLNSPWIMLDQDEDGWMCPSPSLPWNNVPSIETYRSLNGLELNYRTGKMRFLFRPVKSNDPTYTRLISTFDLAEMLERNIQGAFFSLDPVDPEILYHPFNQMRFGPDAVYKTELFNTMFITDYLLKFLTVGREVQGMYPYDTRSLTKLTKHLPLYLRKIIEDFHEEQQSESLHRFWIEAEEVPIAIDDKKLEQDGIHRVALGDLKMVVKKHQMALDVDGNLIDTTEKDEGWNFYVLSENYMRRLNREDCYSALQVPAIIIIEGQNKIYFLDKTNNISQAFSMPNKPKVYREKLIRLSKMARESDGKVVKDSQNSCRLYQLTRDITEHWHQPHKFSPEYVFAQEFTAHYNEFAQYYPEFGRLKELCRITVLVKLMHNLRESNKKNIARLEDILNDVSHWRTRGNEITRAINQIQTQYKTDYDKTYDQVHKQLKEEFGRLSRELNYERLLNAKLSVLQEIQNQIGSLTFSTYSTEVNEICDAMYNENYRINKNKIVAEYGWPAWNEVESEITTQIRSQVNNQRSEIAETLGSQKIENYRDQLNQIFASQLDSSGSYEFNNLINNFINGNAQPLATVLAKKERAEAEKQICQSFSDQSKSDVIAALNNSTAAISRMAKKITDEQFSQYKEQVEAEVVKANKVVPDEKQEIRTQRDKLTKVETTFKKVGLAKNDKEINLARKCLWVLSNLRRNKSTGPSLVYGGVHVEPRVNVLPSNSSQHQNLISSTSGSGGNNPVNSGNVTTAERSMRSRLRDAELPSRDKIRFVPKNDYHPSEPLQRGENHGYMDRFDNEWTKGPSRTPGQPFEWDVQLSAKGKKQLGWASRDGNHINVSLDGKITHR